MALLPVADQAHPTGRNAHFHHDQQHEAVNIVVPAHVETNGRMETMRSVSPDRARAKPRLDTCEGYGQPGAQPEHLRLRRVSNILSRDDAVRSDVHFLGTSVPNFGCAWMLSALLMFSIVQRNGSSRPKLDSTA